MRRITAGGRGPSGGATAARWPLSGLLGVGYVLAMALVITQMITGATRVDSAAGPAMGLFTIAAAGLAARAGGHRRLDRRSRRAWRLISASFVVLLASFVALGITTNAGDPLAFPTVGDAIRLLAVPILLTGLLTLPRRTPGVGAGNAKVALDIGMVVAGGAMLLWFLVVGPVLTAGSQPLDVLFFATAYPVSDLALVAGAMLVTMRTTVSSSRRPALLLAAALLSMVVGDVYLSWLRAHAQGTDYAGWQFLCWVTATFLMALAASEKCRHVRFHDDEDGLERTVRPVPYLPYAAVVLGYGLLLAVALRLPMYPYGGLAIGAVTTTALVVARQIVALRENHRLLVTDGLTGLANRARLRDQLARTVERSRRTGQPVAVLIIDLDGFKAINDTLGHEAGDTMLIEFARILERTVRPSDVVARLGGDEFAVILHAIGSADNAAAVTSRLHAALVAPVALDGHLVSPQASVGMAVFGPDCDTVSALLRRADAEMYRAKRERRGAAGPVVDAQAAAGALT